MTANTGNSYHVEYDEEQWITIPRPHVPYGPHHVSEDESDVDYLRKAAKDLEQHYKPFGSNVRDTVVKLLRDTADSIAKTAEETAEKANEEADLPNASVQTVNDVIAKYQHGDREQMMTELRSYSYQHGDIQEGSHDVYVPGSWDKVREAYINNMLTDEEYDRLQDHHYSEEA